MKAKSYASVLSESERVMSADWAEVVCHSIKAAIGVNDANLTEAYTHQEASVEAFLRIFKTLTRPWLPILKQLLIDLRKLGSQVRAHAHTVHAYTAHSQAASHIDMTARLQGMLCMCKGMCACVRVRIYVRAWVCVCLCVYTDVHV
jgi:hypothetical protein